MSRRRLSRAALVSGLFLALLAAPAAAQTTTVAHDAHTIFAGAIVGGYTHTWVANDGQVQSIEEWKTTGNPKNRTSAAEHHYMLDLPPGSSHTFFVKATTTDNGEGDDWRFLWSLDDQSWTEFLLFPEGGDTTLSATVPAWIAGVVHIAVVDADRTGGNGVYDTISIDHLYVDTATGGPPAAPSDLVATALSDSSIRLDWTDNSSNEDEFRIERIGGPTWIIGADVTTYTDTGLAASTTYAYVVYAHNGEGDSALSNQASATTLMTSTFTKVMVTPGGKLPVHALDTAGTPGIAYFNAGVLEFKLWNGNDWDLHVIEVASDWRRPAVAFSEAGPWGPAGVWGICYISSNLISLAEFHGGSWTITRITGKSYWDRYDLAYDPNGDPGICYDESGSGRKGRGLVLERRIGGVWQDETVHADGARDSARSLRFDTQGNPSIAYGIDVTKDTWSDTLKYAWYDSLQSEWQFEILESHNLFWGSFPHLALDSIGTPAIVHGGVAGPDMDVRYLIRDGSPWTPVDVVALGTGTGLVFDANDLPHISYVTADRFLWQAAWDGSAWQHELIDTDARQVGPVRLDAADHASIAYRSKIGGAFWMVYAYQ